MTWTDATRTRLHVATIVGATLLALAPQLFTRQVWNPDAPRYMEVARAMTATGQYLVPRLNGDLYPDKPPLVFWASAALYRLGFGLSSGRVVALLATLGTVLFTYALGRRLYGPAVGLLAALVTLTSGLFLHISGLGVLDPPLTFFVVGSIYCAVRAFERGGRSPGPWWLGVYGAIALGVLVKGPVALSSPGLVVLAYGLARRREVRGGGWWHLLGALLFAAVVAAWLVPACIQGGAAYSDNILRQPWKRVAHSPSHRQPFYFYLMHSAWFHFPWTLLLVLAVVWAVRRARREEGAALGLEFWWLAVLLVCFSAVSGKRVRYLLPLMPAAGLLTSRYLCAVASGAADPSRWHRGLWLATFGLLAALGGALAAAAVAAIPLTEAAKLDPADVALLREALSPARVAIALGGGAALLAASIYGLRLPRSREGERRRARAVVCGMLSAAVAVSVAAMPVLDRFKSGRWFVREATPYLERADEVCLLQTDFSGVYNLFTGRLAMPVLADKWKLRRKLYERGRVAVIARQGKRVTIEEMTRHLRRPNVHVAVQRRAGARTMLLIVNWRQEAAADGPP